MRSIVLLLTSAVLSAAPAQAQIPAPAPATGQGLGGSVVTGLCLLSREAVFANARVGQAATARLRQIAEAAQAEVGAARQSIDAEIRAFQTEAAGLSAEQRQSRERALAARLEPVQALASQRTREIEATRARALERIATEAQPAIAEAYRARGCGLLVDRGSVLGGNLANDLTAAVVQALDARITTITFEREALAAQTGTPVPVRR